MKFALETSEERKHDPYRALWCAVIAQAYVDAAFDTIEGSAINNHLRGVDTRQARIWFMSRSEDFRNVCEWAGTNWQYVERKYKESLFNGVLQAQKNAAARLATKKSSKWYIRNAS